MVFCVCGRRINSCVRVKIVSKELKLGIFKSLYLDLPYITLLICIQTSPMRLKLNIKTLKVWIKIWILGLKLQLSKKTWIPPNIRNPISSLKAFCSKPSNRSRMRGVLHVLSIMSKNCLFKLTIFFTFDLNFLSPFINLSISKSALLFVPCNVILSKQSSCFILA